MSADLNGSSVLPHQSLPVLTGRFLCSFGTTLKYAADVCLHQFPPLTRPQAESSAAALTIVWELY